MDSDDPTTALHEVAQTLSLHKTRREDCYRHFHQNEILAEQSLDIPQASATMDLHNVGYGCKTSTQKSKPKVGVATRSSATGEWI